MKTKPNKAVREARKTIGLTQGEFAAMVGASMDAVVSWELGRNPLSRKFARRIALATGADEKLLLSGRGAVMAYHPWKKDLPFTAETYEEHRKSYWGRTDEAAARRHYRNCADALELVFVAAARSKDGKEARQLPAVVDSFVAWCRETAEAFGLEEQILKQLDQRKHKVPLTMSYGQWREALREDPAVCRTWGFKDDPAKKDEEHLCLVAELVPPWRPGYEMRKSEG